jgi:TonB family protein
VEPPADTGPNYTFEDQPISASAKEKMTPKFVLAPPPPGAPWDKDNVSMALRVGTKGVHACYVTALRKKADVQGRLEIKLTASAAGAPSKVEVSNSTTSADALDKCVVGVMKNTKFPKPPSPATVTWPFAFTPQP